MTPIQLTMLWEATDPQAALEKRFHFASSIEATQWLETTLAEFYDVEVLTVDRLVISSYSLLAWLTTPDGQLLAKCCSYLGPYGRFRLAISAYNTLSWLTTSVGLPLAKYHLELDAHNRMTNVANLLAWLAQKHVPVSVPLLSRTGHRQIRKDHLSIGVQRLIPGELLDPMQTPQTQAAAITLGHLHRALASYPRATDFGGPSALPQLAATIEASLNKCKHQTHEPSLLAGIELLSQSMNSDGLPTLTPQLIHRDYRSANILWHAEAIAAVLDFDDVCWGYRVNDLAWAAVHLGTRYHDWGPVSDEVRTAFLADYRAQHPLTAEEQRWLPRLLLWHSINLAGAAAGGAKEGAAMEAVTRLSVVQ